MCAPRLCASIRSVFPAQLSPPPGHVRNSQADPQPREQNITIALACKWVKVRSVMRSSHENRHRTCWRTSHTTEVPTVTVWLSVFLKLVPVIPGHKLRRVLKIVAVDIRVRSTCRSREFLVSSAACHSRGTLPRAGRQGVYAHRSGRIRLTSDAALTHGLDFE